MLHYDQYKKVKRELIRKYKGSQQSRESQDIDQFISINEFLAESTSKGPMAESGLINYKYQSGENIANYIYLLINELGYKEVMCMPDYLLRSGRIVMKNTITYAIDSDKITVPYDFKNQIEQCTYARFIYTAFWIMTTDDMSKLSHANILIIDLFKKTIERYEPYGKATPGDKYKTKESTARKIDNRIQKIVSYLRLDLKYLSPIDMAPLEGFQTITDAYKGMCITYSIMYLHLRIMNPDVSQNDIIKYFAKKPAKKLKDVILRYAKYIEDTLKNNSDIVNVMNKQLYHTEPRPQPYIISNPSGEQEIYY